MVTSLRLGHLGKYGALARVLLAHREALAAGGASEVVDEQAAQQDAEALAAELEAMGPTYIKLGQLLASRVDLLPAPYAEALGRLQDRAEPVPFDQVRAVVEEELGMCLSAAFARFNPEPLGSASLAQVHRATLASGVDVAVKVQRPGIRRRILDDMDVLGELAAALDQHVAAANRAGLAAVVDEFRRTVVRELDFRQEAANLRVLATILAPYDRLWVPQPFDDHSAQRVLTMTLVDGRPLRSVAAGELEPEESTALLDQLFKAYLDQALVHGVLHADPHAGNLLLDRSHRLALVDGGMVIRIPPRTRDGLLRLLVALTEGNGEAAAKALEGAGEPLESFDRRSFVRRVEDVVAVQVQERFDDAQVGTSLAALAQASVASGLRPAPELSVIGKALLNFDGVARALAPGYSPTAAVREHTASILQHRVREAASPSRLVGAALEAKDFAEQLPSRMNKVLETLADGSIRIDVQGVDESEIMRSMQKLANRASAGLVVAAFVLAAAVFSLAHGGPRWWGVSSFSVVFLALAAAVGVAILVAMLRHDLPQRRREGARQT